MFFIWNGFGFIVPIITFTCAVICQILLDKIFGQNYYSTSTWGISFSFLISSAICWILGTRGLKTKEKIVIDKETNEEIVLTRSHSFFFIPIKYWSYILVVIAVLVFVSEFI